MQRRLEKSAAGTVSPDKFINRTGMGEIAAASAGLQKFAAGRGVSLNDQHLGLGLCGEDGRHQAGRAGSKDADLRFHACY